MRLICLLFVWVWSSEASKPSMLFAHRPLLARIRYASLADDNPEDSSFENSTINYFGQNVMINMVVYMNREIEPITKAIIFIRRCSNAAEEANCELYQTWRFGKETCTLINARNVPWSSIADAVHPRIVCPIKKGRIEVNNATVDMAVIEKMFQGIPVEKYFWRIKIDAYDHKKFISMVGGGYAIRGKA